MIRSERRRAGHVARVGKKKNAQRSLVGKSEWRRQLRRPKSRWEDNIKVGLIINGVYWTDLTDERGKCQTLVNTAMNQGFQQNAENISTIWGTILYFYEAFCPVQLLNSGHVSCHTTVTYKWLRSRAWNYLSLINEDCGKTMKLLPLLFLWRNSPTRT
jgi:hypothetical protein